MVSVLLKACVMASSLALSVVSLAQTVSFRDTKTFNLAISRALESYQICASPVDDVDREAFVALFDNPESPCVFNDLLGTAGFQEQLTPQEYIKTIPSQSLLRIDLSDVSKEGDVFVGEDGKLHRKIALSKAVMIIDPTVYKGEKGGVLFDTSDIYGKTSGFRLLFEFVFDTLSGECRIGSIKMAEKVKVSPLDKEHFSVALKPEGKYGNSLLQTGEKLQFNYFDQALIDVDSLSVSVPDVLVSAEVLASGDHYDVVNLNFRKIRGRMKLKGSYAPSYAYKASSTYDGVSFSSSAIEAGLDFGYAIPVSNHYRLGLYAGAGVSLSSLDFTTDVISYKTDIFLPDRESNKAYSFYASEGLSFMDFVVPVYFENEVVFTDRLVADIDLGAKAYYNYKTELKDYKVENVRESSGSVFNRFVFPANYTRSMVDVSLFGMFNLEYGFTKKMFFTAAAGYEYGLNPSYCGNEFYYSPSNGIYPFVSSSRELEDIAYRSIVGSVTYTRNALWLSFGFKFKL